MGFTFDYFTNLIHKISKEGFFRWEVEDQIVFGYKTLVPQNKYVIQKLWEDNEDEPFSIKQINSFYIFYVLERDEK